MKGNRNYKDSVFTLLFQDERKLIELYNAIEGTNYTEDTKVQINTLEKALYMDRGNDISFLLDGKFIVLIEHQSTVNKNMPFRFLLYIARIYEKLIDSKSVYKEEQISLPTPEFIVLYNGGKNYPKEKIIKLSEAFMEKNVPVMLDLSVKVININYDKASEVLEKSKTLKDYSYFIHQVKYYKKKPLTLEESIEQAMKDCINQNMLKEFLEENGSEVINMLFTEFNLEDAKEVWMEEAEERGKEIGIELGEKRGIEKGEKKAKVTIAMSLLDMLDLETIAIKTGLSLEELNELREKTKDPK